MQRPHMIGAWVNSIAKNMLKNRLRSEQRLEALTEASQADGMARKMALLEKRMMKVAKLFLFFFFVCNVQVRGRKPMPVAT